MTASILPRQSDQQAQRTLHAPFPPQNASLGGVPSVDLDVPVTTVFLFLYILGAISHMTILQVNQKRGHKFLISGMTFGFCFSRAVTCVMRIVWATRPTNISVAIAAQVFVAAGVVLLFIINLVFAQRIVRAAHPHSGWHPAFSWFFKAIYIIIVVTLIMLITSVIQSFYTLNKNTRRIDRDIQLYGSTYYSLVSFLPIPLVIGGLLIPRNTRVEKFGAGRFRSKIAILLTAAVLLCLGATFRCGTNYLTPRPREDPAWYHSKACFYIFNFTVEIMVVFLYIVVRVDKRFWVPNGAHTAGDYVQGEGERKESMETRLNRGILPEEQVFDDVPEEEFEGQKESRRGDEEAGKA